MTTVSRLDRIEGCLPLGDADRLLVRGSDARDFLHRISASEVRDLAEGQCRHLVFVDDKGGLVDAPLVALEGDAWRVFAGPGRGPDLAAWLERWVIVDDVVIEADPRPAWLLGEPDAATSEAFTPVTAAGPAVQVGEAPENPLALEEWDARCFRAERFWTGTPTSARPNPLELGWKPLIAFDKGCYIGQEVIARMDTYDKVRRALARVSLAGPADPGTALSREGRKCGSVLCSVRLDNANVAWAVLDKTLAPGTRLDNGATLITFA